MIAAAIGREEIASYVDALFLVYIALIFIRIVLSWIPRLPYNPILRGVVDFVNEVTDPYLRQFRKVLPPLSAGGMGLDLTPIIGLIVLYILRAVVVGVIAP
ncbi:MAG TPA: YggT family protein [Solirubrobacterales bacterium]|nr:YggT family protein [Solirubrobacterales bacterium]